MHPPFDGHRYLSHLRKRWPLGAGALIVSLAISLLISVLLPTKYTAKVSLVIEPPAGIDPRAATVVSPIYLESLRTYAYFASSDQLFAEAVERFNLRDGERPIESLKRSILSVEMPRNTKVLEISATLGDPKRAHDLALHIAKETVSLNRKTNLEGSSELTAGARKELETTAARLRSTEADYLAVRTQSPSVESLKAQLEELTRFREEVSSLALTAEVAVSAAGETSSGRLESLKSRAERLKREEASIEKKTVSTGNELARRSAAVDRATSRLQAATALDEQAEKRLLELRSVSGFSGERIVLVDPGVVPERPSSPNIPLNLVVAAVLGSIASLVYLTFEYSVQPQSLPANRPDEDVWERTRS